MKLTRLQHFLAKRGLRDGEPAVPGWKSPGLPPAHIFIDHLAPMIQDWLEKETLNAFNKIGKSNPPFRDSNAEAQFWAIRDSVMDELRKDQ